MGMIAAFNELLACVVTGSVTALVMLTFARLGWFPVVFFIAKEEEEVEE